MKLTLFQDNSFFKARISRRLVVYILVFSSIVTLFLTAAQLFRDYKYGVEQIDTSLEELKLINKELFEEHSWLLNISSINILMEGILRRHDVIYVALIDEKGQIKLAQGELSTTDTRSITFPLTYTYRNEEHHLGEVRIVATLENVYQHLIDTVFVILISQAIKTFLVSVFIIFLLWHFVIKHLDKISRYALNLELINTPEDIYLDRKPSRWTKNDEFEKLIESFNVMRKKLYRSYRDLEFQSLHDSLTGLPNRRLLEEQLTLQLRREDRTHCRGGLMFIDLDHFKLLNDSLGHSVGDQLLKEIARRLADAVRGGDVVARTGGDEFVVLIGMLSEDKETALSQIIQIGHKVRSCLNTKIPLAGENYVIRASIGVAPFGGSSVDAESIMKQADIAMFKAKSDGRNTIRIYQKKMQAVADHRLSTERRLHEAIQNNEFILNYQPKYNDRREIVSAEALIRWRQTDGTILSPFDFINIAEDSGLIVPIGLKVLGMVIQHFSRKLNQLEHLGLENIAINISPRQFSESDFVEEFSSLVTRANMPPSFFMLEITEDVVVNDVKDTVRKMNQLEGKGFRLSIDDFGTGYSSLRYLKDFPLNELKIDISFVKNIATHPKDVAIVSSIISMAKNLGLDTVAEGVEQEEQFKILRDLGCQKFQGYLLSKPLPYEEFMKLLEGNKNNS